MDGGETEMQLNMEDSKHGRALDQSELEGLLIAVAEGDHDALADLYRRTKGAVNAMALSILKNPYDAQDVTQDTFVRVFENAGKYKPGGTPIAWILTIARNEALMRLRQDSRLVDMDTEDWLTIPDTAPAVTVEDRDLLQTALATLDEKERQVVLLYAAGLKHREIAALLRLPLSTILSKYQRALRKLKRRMEGVNPS